MELKTFTSWYESLEPAFQNTAGQEMDELLDLVHTTGMNSLQSPELRQASTAIEQKYGERLSVPARWLLRRLENAGYQPTYPDYLGLDILTVCEETACDAASKARAAFRLIDEIIVYLIHLPQLQKHHGRKGLQRRANAILDKTREYTFSMVRTDPPSRDIIQLSLVPESGVPDELIFIRVLQCSELIFGTAKDLADRALEWVSYGEILPGVETMHWIAGLSELIVPFLGLMSPMTKESWHQIRPLILAPSAIQSMNFHRLSANLGELRRILQHPRSQKSHLRYLPVLEELITYSIAKFQVWDRAHLAVATKYNAGLEGKSDGVQWLEKRESPFSSE